jgi:hypothetical protein
VRPHDSGWVDKSPLRIIGKQPLFETLPKFDNAKKPVWIKITASKPHAQTLFVQSCNPLHLIGVIT